MICTQNGVKMDWQQIRYERDKLIKEVDWRVKRNLNEQRLGLTPTDKIEKLDEYMQGLRDITLQVDPNEIEWPPLNESEVATEWNDLWHDGVDRLTEEQYLAQLNQEDS